MRYLADSNILLRSLQPAHPMYADAVQAVETLIAQANEICVFNQSLIEFWNSATRPVENNGLKLSTAQTATELQRIETMLTILPDNPAVYPEWRRLVIQHSVSGKQVHNTRLVAAMNVSTESLIS